MKRSLLVLATLLVGLLAQTPRAQAVRPFLTDDARTVGGGLLQVETWGLVNEHAGEHWVTAGYGPVEPLELTVGFIWGGEYHGENSGPSLRGPLLQGKVLIRRTESDQWPGIAVSVGTLAPTGTGSFDSERWSHFGYVAFSQSFFHDDLLLHLNVGFSAETPGSVSVQPIGGIGFQARVLGPIALLGEVVIGDALDTTAQGGAAQVGYRLLLSNDVQVDGTFGWGLWGHRDEWWVTAGLRVVLPRLYTPPA